MLAVTFANLVLPATDIKHESINLRTYLIEIINIRISLCIGISHVINIYVSDLFNILYHITRFCCVFGMQQTQMFYSYRMYVVVL